MRHFNSIKRKILENQLKSPNDALRLAALTNLTEQLDEKMCPRIIELLEDPNEQIRERSIQILKDFPSEQAINRLIHHLIEFNIQIRSKIVETLHKWDPDQFSDSWNKIIENLKDPQKTILFDKITSILFQTRNIHAEVMISALGLLSKAEGVEILFDYWEMITNELMQPIPSLRKATAQSFEQQIFVRMISKTIRETIIKLKPTPEQISTRVLNKNTYFRREFIELLRLLPIDPQYYDIYLQLLEDPDLEIHKIAISLIGQYRNPKSTIPLIKAITPNMPGIIIETLRILILIDPSRFNQIIYRNWMRIYSLLNESEEKEIIPPLFDYLLNWNEKTRQFAEDILKTVVNIKYLPILEQLLQRPEQFIKTSVIRILKAWKHPQSIIVILKQFIVSDWTKHDELLAAIQELDPNRFRDCDKNQVFKRLTSIEREAVIGFILENNPKGISENASYFLALIPHQSDNHEHNLISLIEHTNLHIAGAAIQTLGELKSTVAVPYLIDKLKKYHRSMKLYLIQTLGKIQDPRALSPIIACFEDSDQFLNRAILTALSQFENNVVEEELIRNVENQSWNIRYGVAFALGALGTWRSAASLIKLTCDDYLAVKRMAIFSLGEIRSDESLNQLKSLVLASDENIVVATLLSLGKFPEPKVHHIFLELLDHPIKIIAQTAAIQLGNLGDPRPGTILKEILYDEASNLKKDAIRSLTSIATSESVQILLDALSIPNTTLNEHLVGAINQLLAKIPSVTLPLLHKHYRLLTRSIPECYNLYEILPSLTGYRLYQFKSLDPGSLLDEWLRAHHPLALQIVEEYGTEAEPYLERIIEQIPPGEDKIRLEDTLQRIRHNNRVQMKEDFFFLL
jgi:HEAT repeat protein